MEISRSVRNGVVVFDEGGNLPVGTCVVVVTISLGKPRIEGEPGQLPVVHGGVPDSIHLTDQRIHEILDEQDEEPINRRTRGER
jgi:hypothetical protein